MKTLNRFVHLSSTFALLALAPFVASAQPLVPSDARLMNLSARAMVGTGSGVLIAGFVCAGDPGSTPKHVLMRGMGPALPGMGGMMSGSLANPVLTVYDGQSNPMATDMGWMNSPIRATGDGASAVQSDMQPATAPMMSALGAFMPAMGSADSALMMRIPMGSYTEVISGSNNSNGIALAECYDADAVAGNGANTARLVNMSARAHVGTGAGVLIAGFVIGAGPSGRPETVMLRAMGPALAFHGVTGVLAGPTMTLYDGDSKPIASNAGWTHAATMATGNGASPVQAGIAPASLGMMDQVGAFPPEAGSADCAMVATLPPGSYTLIISGLPDASGNPMTGIALVEVYEMR